MRTGVPADSIDFYLMDEAWTRLHNEYPCLPQGDPADVANWYGRALILRESLCPALEGLAQVRNQEILLDTDYDCEQTSFSGQIGVRMRVGSLLWIGLTLLGGAAAWYRGYRQLETKDKKTADKQKNRQAKAA